MIHNSLAITLDTQKNTTAWMRAGVFFAALAGISTGLILYGHIYHRVSIPRTQEQNIELVMNILDWNTRIGSEIYGYTGTKTHEMSFTQQIPKEYSFALSSLFPRSYFVFQNHVIPFRVKPYGIRIFLQNTHEKELEKGTRIPFLNTFLIENFYFDKDNNIVVSGHGSEKDFLSFLQIIKRGANNKPFVLENGNVIEEVATTLLHVDIETHENISTYSSENPYFIATYNKTNSSWTYQNTNNYKRNELPPVDRHSCNDNMSGNILTNDIQLLFNNTFVTNIISKIKVNNKFMDICMSVDNL